MEFEEKLKGRLYFFTVHRTVLIQAIKMLKFICIT